jgi:CRISPR-associated exonuclease Cas4
VIRAVPLYSDRFGLTGRADGIELFEDGSIAPVEHKAGVRHGRAADVQLCAQALCLEEMFHRAVPVGFVWYGATRRRDRVLLDEDLRSLTISVIEEIRTNISSGVLPMAVADERCPGCQLEPVCMPDIVIHPGRVQRYVESEVLGCR